MFFPVQNDFSIERWGILGFRLLKEQFSLIVTGIYPSSFTNVRFWTNIEFSNVVKRRWGSRGAVSSTTVSRPSPHGVSGDTNLKKLWLFYI